MNAKSLIQSLFLGKIKELITLICTMILIITLTIFEIVIMQNVVQDIVVSNNPEANLALRVTMFVICFISISGLSMVKNKQISNISSNITLGLAEAAYSSLIKAELSEVEKPEVKISADNMFKNAEYIGEEYIGKNIIKVMNNIFYLLGFFILTMVIKPVLGLIVFFSLPFFYVMVKSVTKFLSKWIANKDKTIKDIDNIIGNTTDKIKNIKLMNGTSYEEKTLSDWSVKYKSEKQTFDVLTPLSSQGIEEFLVGVVFSIILGLGAWLSKNPEFSINAGTFIVYFFVIPSVYKIFQDTMDSKVLLSNINSECDELDKLFNLRSEIKSEPINNLEEIHSVKFINVSYSNVPKKPIISNISFELKRGERLAIIANSVEKDAIFEIITKLIKPTEGVVSINNCDINKINTGYLRDIITSIFDNSTIFKDTLMNNIIYPYEFDEYKYNDALNKSGLKELISFLPFRDNTIISEDSKFEEDMLEKIIFANAFYKDSKVYVLNEATKDYDIATEKYLLDEVFKLKNKIIIMLTDKVYNLSRCDKVLIIENGVAVEYGKYSELLQDRTSIFYKMIKKGSISKKDVI